MNDKVLIGENMLVKYNLFKMTVFKISKKTNIIISIISFIWALFASVLYEDAVYIAALIIYFPFGYVPCYLIIFIFDLFLGIERQCKN